MFAPHETYQNPITNLTFYHGTMNDSAAKCPIYQEVHRAEKPMELYDDGLIVKQTRKA